MKTNHKIIHKTKIPNTPILTVIHNIIIPLINNGNFTSNLKTYSSNNTISTNLKTCHRTQIKYPQLTNKMMNLTLISQMRKNSNTLTTSLTMTTII